MYVICYEPELHSSAVMCMLLTVCSIESSDEHAGARGRTENCESLSCLKYQSLLLNLFIYEAAEQVPALRLPV